MATRPLELNCFCIFNRALGSSREDATIQERAEKLLYFFPLAMDLREKVNRMEIFESFLDLSQLIDLGLNDQIHSLTLMDVRYTLLEFAPKTFACLGINLVSPIVGQAVELETSSDSLASRMYKAVGWTDSSPDATVLEKPSTEAMRAVLKLVADHLLLLKGPAFYALPSLTAPEILNLKTLVARHVPDFLQAIDFKTLSSASTHALGARNSLEHCVSPKEIHYQCQSMLFEGFFRRFEPANVFFNRKMIVMRDFSLVFSSLEVSETSVLVALLRRSILPSTQVSESGFADLTVKLNVDDDPENKLAASVKGSRSVSPVVYVPANSDWDSTLSRFIKTRLVMLRGKNRMQMVVFLRDVDDEEKIFDSLDIARRLFQPELDRLGEVLFPVKAPAREEVSLKKAFVYVNETNRVVLASQPLVLNVAKCGRSAFLIKSQLPREASKALDTCRAFLRKVDADSSVAICSEGNWTVSGKRSGTRYLFRFALNSNSLAFASQDAFHALILEADQLEAIIKEHFSSFLIV